MAFNLSLKLFNLWLKFHFPLIRPHTGIEYVFTSVIYRIVGKFGELSAIHQTKLVLKINYPLADLLIRQTFYHQNARNESIRQTFPLPNFPAIR